MNTGYFDCTFANIGIFSLKLCEYILDTEKQFWLSFYSTNFFLMSTLIQIGVARYKILKTIKLYFKNSQNRRALCKQCQNNPSGNSHS